MMRAGRSESDTRNAIVAEARSWIGTTYHHAARLKGVGVDCAQLLIAVYAAVGLIEEFSPGMYSMDWALNRDDERFLGFVQRFARETDRPLPGDVLVFRYFRCFSHGAIVVDDERMIHAYIGRGVELADRAEFANRPVRAFTLIGGA
jgi:NlpC/P60 family putative phage cell wall peptidase